MQLDQPVRGFRLARNPSWRSSALTGLKFGLWLAPSTLLIAVGRPLRDAVYGLTFAVLRGLAWVFLCLSLIVMGLCGFVTADDNQG